MSGVFDENGEVIRERVLEGRVANAARASLLCAMYTIHYACGVRCVNEPGYDDEDVD